MTAKQLSRLLRDLGLEQITQRGNNISACCPNPEHPENRPSWGISTKPPHLHGCFACGYAGSLYGLLIRVGGYDKTQAEIISGHSSRPILARVSDWQLKESLGRTNLAVSPKDQMELFTEFLAYPRHIKVGRYLTRREFGRRVIVVADLRYDPFLNAMVIPWRLRDGELVAMARRALSPHQWFRYKFSENVDKGKLLYVPEWTSQPETLVLVEGELDALRVWEAGFTAAAIGTAKNLSAEQLALIYEEFRPKRLVLALDSDRAGRIATFKVTRQLLKMGKRDCFVVRWPRSIEKLDPATFTVLELSQLIGSAPRAFGELLSLH